MIPRLAIVALFVALASGCGNDTEAGGTVASSTSSEEGRGPIEIGPQVQVDLAIYLVDGATDVDLTTFIDTVLAGPPSDGRPGSQNLPGIQAVLGDYRRMAAYLNFTPNATDTDRQAVIDAAFGSGLVAKALEDIVPNDQP